MRSTIIKTIGGKEYGFAIVMYTWEIVCEALDMSMNDFFATLNSKSEGYSDMKAVKSMRYIVYAANKAYYDMYGKGEQVNQYSASALLTENPNLAMEITQLMGTTTDTGKELEGQQDTEKKSRSKKLESMPLVK